MTLSKWKVTGFRLIAFDKNCDGYEENCVCSGTSGHLCDWTTKLEHFYTTETLHFQVQAALGELNLPFFNTKKVKNRGFNCFLKLDWANQDHCFDFQAIKQPSIFSLRKWLEMVASAFTNQAWTKTTTRIYAWSFAIQIQIQAVQMIIYSWKVSFKLHHISLYVLLELIIVASININI